MARIVGIGVATLAALSLTACALPLPIAVASYVADGVLLAATGKTMGDAAISTATEQDCAIWRVLKDEPVCRDYAPGEAPTVVARMPDAAEGGEGGVPMPVALVLAPMPVPDDKPILVADLPPPPQSRPPRLPDWPPVPIPAPTVQAPVPAEKPVLISARPPLPQLRPSTLDSAELAENRAGNLGRQPG